VKEDKDVQKTLADVILHKVDAEKGEGPELAKAHGVRGYPTFIMTNAKVEPMDRWIGYTKDMLADNLAGALADMTTIDEKKARFAKTPTTKDAVKLAGFAGSMGEYGEAIDLYKQASTMDKGNHYAEEIFESTYSGLRRETDGFDFARTQSAAKHALEHASSDNAILNVCNMMAMASKKAENETAMVSYIKTAIEKTNDTKDEKALQTRSKMMPSYALHVEKNEKKAVELKKANMAEGWMNDAGQINNYAWWAFENGVDTKNALKMAMKGVELAPPGKEKAMILDTAAELCNSLEDCARSVELTQMAMAEDPESEFYKEQLVRFQEALAKQ